MYNTVDTINGRKYFLIHCNIARDRFQTDILVGTWKEIDLLMNWTKSSTEASDSEVSLKNCNSLCLLIDQMFKLKKTNICRRFDGVNGV